jgi:hypothetical protein
VHVARYAQAQNRVPRPDCIEAIDVAQSEGFGFPPSGIHFPRQPGPIGTSGDRGVGRGIFLTSLRPLRV